MKLKDREGTNEERAVICPKCGSKTTMCKNGATTCKVCEKKIKEREVEREVLTL